MSAERREWLIGAHAATAALDAGRRQLFELWVRAGTAPTPGDRLGKLAAAHGVAVRSVPARTFQERVGEAAAVALSCGPYPYADEGEIPAAGGDSKLVVVLDGIQDPQNLGAIARSAEAAGAVGLILGRRRAATVTPAVVRAAAGAIEYLPTHRVTNVVRTLEHLKQLGYWTVGLAPEGAQSWTEPDYRGGVALVVGGEGAGLRRLVAARCDHLVALPMRGRVESLNASAAFAAVAFEVVRQQKGA